MKSGHKTHWLFWIFILLTASLLRFTGADWDQGFALHPDERYLVDLSRKVAFYTNPCDVDPLYPYGHLPLYLLSPLLSSQIENDPLYSARLFSGILGVFLVAVTGSAGLLVGGKRVGWVAALTITFAPLLIQNARFYTVDTLATLASTISLLAIMRKRWCIAGIAGAISVASKLSLVWLWPVLVISIAIMNHKMLFISFNQHIFMRALCICILSGGITYFILSPWIVLKPVQCLMGPVQQLRIVTGNIEVPYTLPFTRTLPYLYAFKQMAIWGLGPVCTLIGVIAAVTGIFHWKSVDPRRRIMLIWVMVYFAVIAGLHVKYPRYLLPLYPWMAILCINAIETTLPSRSHNRLRVIAVCMMVLPTVIPGLAQVSIYYKIHPWITASDWITDNIHPGSSIAYESWEHPLPLLRTANPYTMIQLPVYAEESSVKDFELEVSIKEADVVVIASRRAYGSFSRNKASFSEMISWYKELLGSNDVLVFSLCPAIGPVAFSDDPFLDNGLPELLPLTERCNTDYVMRIPRLDESLRVYDSPTVIVVMIGE